jgi:hypothetical protein
MHLKPTTGMEASLEGVWAGVYGGRYILLLPSLVEGENATVTMSSRVEIPRENVLFWEVLSR